MLSPPISYPLPLLSIATHVALLNARLPRLKSELEEDPLFDDDFEASGFLYPFDKLGNRIERPPITLLAAAVGSNYIFDPSKEELAAVDAVVALSVALAMSGTSSQRTLRLVSSRMIDTPARYTSAGVPNAINTATGGTAPANATEAFTFREMSVNRQDVWTPPRGGIKRSLLAQIIKASLEPNGVASDILEGLVNFQY